VTQKNESDKKQTRIWLKKLHCKNWRVTTSCRKLVRGKFAAYKFIGEIRVYILGIPPENACSSTYVQRCRSLHTTPSTALCTRMRSRFLFTPVLTTRITKALPPPRRHYRNSITESRRRRPVWKRWVCLVLTTHYTVHTFPVITQKNISNLVSFKCYGRILLIRHLKGIRKKWRIRRSDELRKQVKTIIEARILCHSNSYPHTVLLFAVKCKFMTLWLNTTITTSALSGLLHSIKHLLNL